MKSIAFGLINTLLGMNTVLHPYSGFGQFQRPKKPVQSAEQKQTALAKAELKREERRMKRMDNWNGSFFNSYNLQRPHWQQA